MCTRKPFSASCVQQVGAAGSQHRVLGISSSAKGPDTLWGHKCPGCSIGTGLLFLPSPSDRGAGRLLFIGRSVHSSRSTLLSPVDRQGARPTAVGMCCVSLHLTLGVSPQQLCSVLDRHCREPVAPLSVTESKTSIHGAAALSCSYAPPVCCAGRPADI